MKKYSLSLTLFAIFFLMTGCNSPSAYFNKNTNTQGLPEDKNGNFVLYVSNQSFDISPVDIKIYIDDMTAVNEDFYVEDQHAWEQFQFNLSVGTHKIKIESLEGNAILEENFDIVDKKHWAVVNYWYYPEDAVVTGATPKHFSFDISNEQYYFD